MHLHVYNFSPLKSRIIINKCLVYVIFEGSCPNTKRYYTITRMMTTAIACHNNAIFNSEPHNTRDIYVYAQYVLALCDLLPIKFLP